MAEWWVLYDIKMAESRVGGLTEDEAERLYQMLE